jgi:serine/threonine protein kinase
MIGQKIGTGSYAQVFKGLYLGTEVAIKRYSNNDEKSFRAFLVEVDINLAIRGHPNIVLFMGAYT